MKKTAALILTTFSLLCGIKSSQSDLIGYSAGTIVPATTIYEQEDLTYGIKENIQTASMDDYDEEDEFDLFVHHNDGMHVLGTLYATDYLVDEIQNLEQYEYYKDEANRLAANFDGTLTFLRTDESELATIESTYLSFYYRRIEPILYFQNDLESISFYIESFDSEAIQTLIDQLDVVGIFPLLKINNLSILEVESYGSGTAFKYKTSNYSIAALHEYSDLEANQKKGALKITMPAVDSIDSIEIAGTYFGDQEVLNAQAKTKFMFEFHSSMHNKFDFMPFEISSISITNSYLAISNKNYLNSLITNPDVVNAYFKPELDSMNFTFTYTEKTVGSSGKVTIGKSQSVDVDIDFKLFTSTENDEADLWSFSEQWTPGDQQSGSIKINSIVCRLTAVVDGVQTVMQQISVDYTNYNIHKYSFNSSKAIRVYYYTMSGYYRNYMENSDNVYVGTSSYFSALFSDLFDIKNWQCFAFSFYFDDERTQQIPNVKKIQVKYQCGYKEPNPESEDGFYENCDDEKKNAIVRTMDVVDGYYLFGRPVDDYGMTLTGDANEAMRTDDSGNVFDYVIYKLQVGKNLDTYITKMDPLQIHYETAAKEVVQMVGNSKGLHVVLDEDGEYRVYDLDGNYCPEYGVGKGSDGTLFPGQDLDKNGIIDEYESVNSNTGKIEQTPPTFEEAPGKNIFDEIQDWFDEFDFSIDVDWGRIIGFALVALLAVVIITNPSIIISALKGLWRLIKGLFELIAGLFKSKKKGKKKKKNGKK